MCTYVHAHPHSHTDTHVHLHIQEHTCLTPEVRARRKPPILLTVGTEEPRGRGVFLVSFLCLKSRGTRSLPGPCLLVSLLQPHWAGTWLWMPGRWLSPQPPPRLNTQCLCESHRALMSVQLSSIQSAFTYRSSPRTTKGTGDSHRSEPRHPHSQRSALS